MQKQWVVGLVGRKRSGIFLRELEGHAPERLVRKVTSFDHNFHAFSIAAYYESEDYDKAIATCEKAVDEARSLCADFKLIAKAYGRIGSCYLKKDDYTNAVKFLNKFLTEHRTPDILNKLHDVERLKKESASVSHNFCDYTDTPSCCVCMNFCDSLCSRRTRYKVVAYNRL
jgi:tetratricopeptide (TPR) repeat protein